MPQKFLITFFSHIKIPLGNVLRDLVDEVEFSSINNFVIIKNGRLMLLEIFHKARAVHEILIKSNCGVENYFKNSYDGTAKK